MDTEPWTAHNLGGKGGNNKTDPFSIATELVGLVREFLLLLRISRRISSRLVQIRLKKTTHISISPNFKARRSSETATYLLLRLRQSLPLIRQYASSTRRSASYVGHIAARPPRLDEEGVGRQRPLGKALVGDLAVRLVVLAAEATAREIGLVDFLGRVALDPGLVGVDVGLAIALSCFLETLSQTKLASGSETNEAEYQENGG